MKKFLKNTSSNDYIFYLLVLSIFFVFMMPFMPYTPLNLTPMVLSGGKVVYFNNLNSANLYLFFNRYYIFYYTLCVVSVAILANRKQTLSKIIDLFDNFSKLTKYAICCFFMFGIISSAFAVSPSIAFKGVSVTFLQFFCIMFVASYIQEKPQGVHFFYVVVLLSLIFFGGSLFLQLSLANYSIYGAYLIGNIQQTLLYAYNCLNPRFLDNYFSWFMPLLLLPWFLESRPVYKIGSFIALSMVWFVLINHGFRTIFVEYAIILPLLFFYSRKYFRITFTVLISTLICGCLLYLLYSDFIMVGTTRSPGPGMGSNSFFRSGDSGRILLWKEAFLIGIQHPLTGIGHWNYFAVTKRPDGYPHNLLLEIWSQWGIPAFIAAAIVIITAIKNLFKNRVKICVNPYYCIFVMIVTAGMIDGMINAMFKTSLGLFGSVFAFGFCLSIFAKQSKSNLGGSRSNVSYLVAILAVGISIFCILILPIIYKPRWI